AVTRSTFAGARRTSATRRPERSLAGRLRGWRGAAVVALAVALVAAGVSAWRGGRHEGPARQALLVLPFEVLGGDSQLDWLREGAVSMLTLDLAHWEDLTVVDYGRTLDLMQAAGLSSASRVSADDARRLAESARANSFVQGRVQRSGDSLLVT